MIAAITGANGFIGQHLVRRFAAAGWAVRPIVRRDYDEGTLPRLFDGADVVVHAAGATRAPTSTDLNRANVDLTTLTLRQATNARVRRFVYVSSQAAAGPASSLETPITEQTTPAPIDAYGRSKLAAEALVRAAGVEHVIVRPVATYGPGDRDFLAMFRLAKRGVAIHPGNRGHWLSIINVADLANAIVACATVPAAAGKTFFLGAEDPVCWRDLFRGAARASGAQLSIDTEVPAILIRIAGLFGDAVARATGRASLVTSEKIALSRPRYWLCSSDRARREIGFAPVVDLQAGLSETYHWYRTAGWL